MKTIIYISLAILLTSCFEDIGNYDYKTIDGISIRGIKEEWGSLIVFEDTIKINPVVEPVEREGKFKYSWAKKVGTGASARWESFSTEKNLVYPILDAGRINLKFEVEDGETGLIGHKVTAANGVSKLANGYYLLKENADGTTDVDMIGLDTAGGIRVLYEDLLATSFDAPLKGHPVGLDYWGYRIANYETGKLEPVPAIRIASNEDIAVINTNDFELISKFEDLFLGEVPEVRNIETLKSTNKITMLINDGQVYCHTNYHTVLVNNERVDYGGNRFYSKILNHESIKEDYSLSSHIAWPLKDTRAEAFLVYDEKSGFFRALEASSSRLKKLGDQSTPVLKNSMNSDLLFMTATATGLYTSDVYALTRKKNSKDSLELITLNTSELFQFSTLREKSRDQLLASKVKIDDASNWCAHQHAKVIYYSIADKLYKYDVLSKSEMLVMSFDGEEITHIDVVNERYITGASVTSREDTKFVVGTSQGGEYIFRKFVLKSDHTLEAEPEFISKGTGKIKDHIRLKPETGPTWMRYYN